MIRGLLFACILQKEENEGSIFSIKVAKISLYILDMDMV